MDEFEQLEAELGEMDEAFGELGLGESDDLLGLGEGLSELGSELEAAGLEDLGVEEFGEEDFSVSSLVSEGAEGKADAAVAGWILRRIARRLLGLLIRLLRRNPRLRRCAEGMRYLLAAVRAARRGRWATAIRYARRAYRAFRRCIRGRR